MGYPCGEAQHHRGVESFADLEGGFDEIAAFFGIRRFQHRDLGKTADPTVVLFILGAVHPGIVGGDQHETAFDAGKGHGHQGIHGDVDTDMLHAGHGPAAGDGGADGDFHGDFFVGRPFGIHFIIFRGVFGNLRRGRTGIGRDDIDTGFPCAQSDGFIACHQLFHKIFLFFSEVLYNNILYHTL